MVPECGETRGVLPFVARLQNEKVDMAVGLEVLAIVKADVYRVLADSDPEALAQA